MFNQSELKGLGRSLMSVHNNLRTILRIGLEPFVDLLLLFDLVTPADEEKGLPAKFDGKEYLFDPEADEKRFTILAPSERDVPEDNMETWLAEERFKVGDVGDGQALRQAVHELITTKASYRRAKNVFEDVASLAEAASKLINTAWPVMVRNKSVNNDIFLSA